MTGQVAALLLKYLVSIQLSAGIECQVSCAHSVLHGTSFVLRVLLIIPESIWAVLCRTFPGGLQLTFACFFFWSPFRKNTEIQCLHPASNSKSCVCVKSVQHILVSMTTTGVLLTTLEANYTWVSFRFVRNWIS